MSFAFGQNQGPIDLSKGGDSSSSKPVRPNLPTPPNGIKVPGSGGLPNPEQETGKVAPQRTAPSLPTPPSVTSPRQVPSVPSAGQRRPEPTPQPVAQPVAQPQQYVDPEPAPVYTQEPSYSHPQQPQQAPQQSYEQPQQNFQAQQPQQAPQQSYEQGSGNGYGAPQQGFQSQPQASFQPTPNGFSSPQPGQGQAPAERIVKVDKKGRPIKEKESKKKAPAKKTSSFAGDRKKVLWARVLVFGVTGMLVLAGVTSFLPKSSGLAPGDGPLILSKVREDLGVTDFPTRMGEGWALGFTEAYLNYDPEKREERFTKLAQYAPEGIIEEIDMRIATPEEIAQLGTDVDAAPEGEEGTEGTEETGEDAPPVDSDTVVPGLGKQVVTDGPYLVRSVMISGGEDAIFTTKTQINDKSWIYMEVPVKYDAETRGMSISGSPTFVQPISPIEIPMNTYSTEQWTSVDDEVRDEVIDDLRNYMQAWAASDEAAIGRYTLKENGKDVATLEALTGLGGQVVYMSTGDLTVEGKSLPEDPSSADQKDFNTRQARMEVRWLEPTSGVTYVQTYELTIQYANDNWFVKDIKNIATSAGQYKDRV